MPTIPLTRLPKSSSSEEFESMCADVLTRKYDIPFMKYGRSGQKQKGIDLVDGSKNNSHIVAQCKNYFLNSYPKLKKNIINDIKACEELSFNVQKFILMTSLERDTDIIDFILNKKTDFDMQIFFWEDIQEEICNDRTLLKKYYPQFIENGILPIEVKNTLISNAELLKQQAEYININYSNYKAACRYESDCNIYNICVSMKNAEIELLQLLSKYYLQLDHDSIATLIEQVKESMPEFFDGIHDETCTTMVYTITNFIDFFSSKEKKEKFIKLCNKIIKKVKIMT